MDKILFRGKRVDNGQWVQGYLVENDSDSGANKAYIVTYANWITDDDGDIDIMETEVYEVIPETVGQFIGMTEKNDKQIFEKDIVKDSNGKIARIEFLPQEMGYVIVWKSYDSRLGHRARGSSYNFDTSLEIIGNIFDNSELMEE